VLTEAPAVITAAPEPAADAGVDAGEQNTDADDAAGLEELDFSMGFGGFGGLAAGGMPGGIGIGMRVSVAGMRKQRQSAQQAAAGGGAGSAAPASAAAHAPRGSHAGGSFSGGDAAAAGGPEEEEELPFGRPRTFSRKPSLPAGGGPPSLRGSARASVGGGPGAGSARHGHQPPQQRRSLFGFSFGEDEVEAEGEDGAAQPPAPSASAAAAHGAPPVQPARAYAPFQAAAAAARSSGGGGGGEEEEWGTDF
jgi:hypothetical protein